MCPALNIMSIGLPRIRIQVEGLRPVPLPGTHMADELDIPVPEHFVEQQTRLVEHAHLQAGDRPLLSGRQRWKERNAALLQHTKRNCHDDSGGLKKSRRRP